MSLNIHQKINIKSHYTPDFREYIYEKNYSHHVCNKLYEDQPFFFELVFNKYHRRYKKIDAQHLKM